MRFNDGSVDPQGRFVVGTLALGAETGEEVLLRISPDGSVETLRTGIRLSNGIGFSPDGGTIYHVDTLANTVSSHSYGPGAFDHDEPWVPVITDFPHFPDGLTVGADGTLWVALWGGSSIRHHALTGELLDVVTVDATQASCPAFVGPDLDDARRSPPRRRASRTGRMPRARSSSPTSARPDCRCRAGRAARPPPTGTTTRKHSHETRSPRTRRLGNPRSARR